MAQTLLVPAASTRSGGTSSSNSNSKTRLTFKGKLYSKGVTTERILRDLKQVQKELSQMEQDRVDTHSLKDVCKQLTQPTLMLHKDKGVKVSIACCLADMLRLFAPDAPFTSHELKDIFQFFIHLLTQNAKSGSGLACPSGPYYADYFYLLDSLSTVKSVILICDVGGAEEMMYDLFKGFLEIVSTTMSKNVEICMTDILSQLIDECSQVPEQVLELLLANFNTKAIKSNPAAHQLAIEVCKATETRLQKYVAQYFTEAISTALEEEDHTDRDQSLHTTYALVMSINRSVPGLLLNVIPQLADQVTSDDVSLRMLAVTTLGRMFGEAPSKLAGNASGEGSLARTYPDAWRAWVGRHADKVAQIRVVWVENLRGILIHHPLLVPEVAALMEVKLQDPDEKVRAAVARLIGSLDYESALHSTPTSLLKELGGRCRDKRASVRAESMAALGKLFDLAYPQIEAHDTAATEHFGWIPKVVLDVLRVIGTESLVLDTVEKYILPFPSNVEDEAAWTSRLLLVLKCAQSPDDFAMKALWSMANIEDVKRPTLFEHFVDICQKYNGGIIDEDEEKVKAMLKDLIKKTAQALGEQPGSDRVAADLLAFAKLNDNRLYRLLRTSMDPKQELKSLLKCRAELLKRLQASSNASVIDTMSKFWRRSSFPFFNRSSVGPLLRTLQNGKTGLVKASQMDDKSQSTLKVQDYDAFVVNAQKLLEHVAAVLPAMFVSHISDLIKCLSDASNSVALKIALRAIAAIACSEPAALTLVKEKKVIDRIAEFVLKGEPMQAKFAAKTLAVLADANARRRSSKGTDGEDAAVGRFSPARTALEEIVEEIARKLGKASGNRLVGYLHATTQIIKHSPDVFEDKSQVIIKDVLSFAKRPWAVAKQEGAAKSESAKMEAGVADPADERDWIEDEDMDADLQARLLTLDVLTKRAEAYVNTEHAAHTATPILKFLCTTLEYGEPAKIGTPRYARARLRLRAAEDILKLAKHEIIDKLIDAPFFTLAFVVQDESYGVRQNFLRRLCNYLSRHKLRPRYNVIPFLVAFDPEEENQKMVRYFVNRSIVGLPQFYRFRWLEVAFARFLHLLAHHPDFNRTSAEDVEQFCQYIDYYLDATSSSQNISLFYYLAGKLKSVRDSATSAANDNIYALSELAQLAIKRKTAQRGWVLDAYAGKISLPNDIFSLLPSKEVQKRIIEQQYLPDGVVKQMNDAIEKVQPKKRPAKSGPEKAVAAATGGKRKQSPTKASKKSKKKAKRTSDDEDEEMEGEEDGESALSDLTDEDEDEIEKAIDAKPRPRPRPRPAALAKEQVV